MTWKVDNLGVYLLASVPHLLSLALSSAFVPDTKEEEMNLGGAHLRNPLERSELVFNSLEMFGLDKVVSNFSPTPPIPNFLFWHSSIVLHLSFHRSL